MSDRPGQGEDRDLLFGVLALQMDLIGRDDLIAAINAWSPDRSRPLGAILRDRGVLDEELRDLIDRLVSRHLSAHGDDLRRSLATIPAAEDLRETVSRIAGLSETEAFGGRADADDKAPASPPVAPSRFGTLRPHQKGGLGEVFLARDFELNRDVALKRLQSRHARNPESRARFLLEAEITGGLEHPGVVPVYSLGLDDDGQPYYAMRFIQGHSLGEAIDHFHKADLPGRDPGERALALRKLLGHFLAACNAIEYAHSRGVLHRDLKPSNIMVGDYGETLVVDWGLAKVVGRPDLTLAGAGDQAPGPGSGDLTLPGAVLGTPLYMSPEQAAGEVDRMGPATDVYGLGATLYAILAGRAPIESSGLAAVLDRVRRGDFPPPREVNPSVTPELEAIALRAMALRPEDRFPGARAIGDAIESWLADVRYRQEQSRALDEVKAQLARLAFEQALHHFQGEEVREGLLWLVRALSSLPESEADLRRLILLNLDAWGSQVHRLVRWFPTQGQVHAVAFSPDGSRMAFAESGDTVRLRDAAEGGPIGLPLVHGGEVSQLAFSPDGNRLATVGRDHTARLWDARTGEPIGEPFRHPDEVSAVAFSPDGQTLATAGADRFARLWDIASGDLLCFPLEHPDEARSIAFHPDGRTLVTACLDGSILIWDAASGRPIREPMRHPSKVNAVAYEPCGRSFAVGCFDKVVQFRDSGTGEPVGKPVPHPSWVGALSFSPDGRLLAVAGLDSARIWDRGTNLPLGAPIHHDRFVYATAFHPGGGKLLTGSRDRSARLWEISGGLLARTIADGEAGARAAAFHPDGRRIATGHEDGLVRVWSAESGEPWTPPLRDDGAITALAYYDSGSRLVTATMEGTASIWHPRTGQRIHRLRGHSEAIWSIAIHPKDTRIATASLDNTVSLWDTESGSRLFTMEGHAAPVLDVAFSPDGRSLATASWDKTARVWDAETGRPITPPMPHNSHVYSLAFTPDGRRLLVTTGYGRTWHWDASSGEKLAESFPHKDMVFSVSLSRDGRMALTASHDRTARLWDLESLQPLTQPLAHNAPVDKAAFSPDGRLMASGGTDGEVRIWDLRSGKPIGPPLGHPDRIVALQFDPLGKYLLAAGGKVQLWKLPTPPPDDPRWLGHRIAADTGLAFDAVDAIQTLDFAAWDEHRRAAEGRRPGR